MEAVKDDDDDEEEEEEEEEARPRLEEGLAVPARSRKVASYPSWKV